MRKHHCRFAALILCMAMLLAALCAGGACEETFDTSFLGKPFPDFTVTDTDGNTFTLSEALKDHEAVLINFWATWCGPCKMEMPYIDEAYQQYGDDVVFLLVNLTDGSRDTVESATAFVEKEGYSFPIYFDVEYDGVYTYGINAIPTTYFIDENGVLYDTQIGSMTHNMLNQKIEELLN